jgi:hypothetical protein
VPRCERRRTRGSLRFVGTAGSTVTTEPPELAPPPFRGVREVRLAVVMFGGVSLAIYMNGVAQELLHLVRSTAPGGAPAAGPEDTSVEPEEYAIPLSDLRSTEASTVGSARCDRTSRPTPRTPTRATR